MAADSLFKIDQLLQIFENEIHYSSFRLNYYVKECLSSKYPLNIASLKHIKNYHFISHEQTIEILNKNEDNVAILCCGYARQFIQYDLPMDMIGMIGTLCNIECIAELRNEALMMLLSSPIDLNKIGEFIPILMKSFKKTQSIDIKAHITFLLRDIGICNTELRHLIFSQHLLQCTKYFRTLLSKETFPSMEEIIKCGIIELFFELAKQSTYVELKHEALWVLLNVTSGPPECTQYILDIGADKFFINLLKTPLYEIQQDALWTLGNIAGDNSESKDILLTNKDLLPNIYAICVSDFQEKYVTNFNGLKTVKQNPFSQFIYLLNTTSWVIGNLCRSSPTPTLQHLCDLIKCMNCLIKQAIKFDDNNNKDMQNEIMINIGWAFSYLTGFDHETYQQEIVKQIENYGIIQLIVNLMDDKNRSIRAPMIRVIGNILATSDENVQKCLNLGILNKYYKVLTTIEGENREKREICWSIANIAAGPLKDKRILIKSNLYPVLIELLHNAKYDVAKEALWCIANILTKSNNLICNSLVNWNVIHSIYEFLNIDDKDNKKIDNKILMLSLESIENIFIYYDSQKRNILIETFRKKGICKFINHLLDDEEISDEVLRICEDLKCNYFDV